MGRRKENRGSFTILSSSMIMLPYLSRIYKVASLSGIHSIYDGVDTRLSRDTNYSRRVSISFCMLPYGIWINLSIKMSFGPYRSANEPFVISHRPRLALTMSSTPIPSKGGTNSRSSSVKGRYLGIILD